MFFKVFKKTFGWYKKGSYICTPNWKTGGKKSQKIFESLEVTAQNFYNSTR